MLRQASGHLLAEAMPVDPDPEDLLDKQAALPEQLRASKRAVQAHFASVLDRIFQGAEDSGVFVCCTYTHVAG